MNNRMKSILLSGAALLLFVPSVLGQNTNMSFNGGYQGSNWTYGSETVGTGFYDGSINGVQVGPGQSSPGMICDDFRDNVYAGETWTANAVSAGSLTSSNIGQTLFGSSIGLAGYQEVAYLVYQMFTTNPNAATQAAYSEAIWALTGSGVAVSALKAQGGLAWALYLAVTSGTEKLTQSQLAGLWIYTPTVPGGKNAQEMWGMVPVPEGGAAFGYLFLAGISCFGAMLLRSRRHTHSVRSV
jgi:hypothetical protein